MDTNYRIKVGTGSHPVASRRPREKRPEWSNILTSTPYREGTRAETQSQQIRRKRGLDKTHSVDFGDFVEIISHVAEELRTTEKLKSLYPDISTMFEALMTIWGLTDERKLYCVRLMNMRRQSSFYKYA